MYVLIAIKAIPSDPANWMRLHSSYVLKEEKRKIENKFSSVMQLNFIVLLQQFNTLVVTKNLLSIISIITVTGNSILVVENKTVFLYYASDGNLFINSFYSDGSTQRSRGSAAHTRFL